MSYAATRSAQEILVNVQCMLCYGPGQLVSPERSAPGGYLFGFFGYFQGISVNLPVRDWGAVRGVVSGCALLLVGGLGTVGGG